MSQSGSISSSAIPPVAGSVGFQAFVGDNQPNITGDGTGISVVFSSITWEEGGSNYNPATGVFTAPSAGKYLVDYSVTLTGLTTLNTSAQFQIDGSLGTSTKKVFNPGVANSAGFYQLNDSIVLDLPSGATVFITGVVSGTGLTVGLQGEFFGQYCYISIVKLSD